MPTHKNERNATLDEADGAMTAPGQEERRHGGVFSTPPGRTATSRRGKESFVRKIDRSFPRRVTTSTVSTADATALPAGSEPIGFTGPRSICHEGAS
jgi:hypothetical protein